METQLWREILSPYELCVDEIMVKFNHLIDEFKNKGEYSPIEQVQGRVKSISSIIDKAQKKNVPLDRIEEEIDDIAGIRIICQFVEDIYAVVDIIRQRKDMIIKEEKDYINHMKKSGYRSYHLIVYYTVETLSGHKQVQVEIQIRTLAMNFWSTIEHSMQYKYKGAVPLDIRRRLSRAADAVIILDQEMSAIKNEIKEAQDSFRMKASMVADILTNIHSLSKVIDEEELNEIQKEFDSIYKDQNMEELAKFNQKLDKIAESYHLQSLSSINNFGFRR
ncbi:MAG: GTP pyrophosphokinase family protein [Clostridiales bacterium]|nr:GTP pyrophosphokinase family protein [Clostridiales bacterium]